MALRRVFGKIDFVGGWKMWFAISGVLLLLGLGAIALGRLNFGIDFQGGATFTVLEPQQQLSEGQVREALPDFVTE